ncbi:hypothetical protein K435DRAFT_860988 [Dendrothele bispora CBS 962.96]|uniref:Uncharacterized protein n=1 Tax=Dendrothele bispora (strain CBS 962.96) TaxID=1314807 RepID=A0A4S8KKC0_DENBC|nr:hypothetical protein K435DRAFT_879992 [Dendrothele bispora CBS 962.96]THU93995.1 hypothetical protein K435DRAFT_860988 [Dendrothele bispora CBS 962.96]
MASASALNVQKRDGQDGKDVTTLSGPQVLTATKVAPSLVNFEPYMISITSKVVWTQYPVPTSIGTDAA